MKNPCISIIVPVYNVENYIDLCVNSLLKQTYTNIEIILVDDGSTDSSGDKCDLFAQIDNRIKVVHKTNGGLSDARNVGTGYAKGEFITYVDSDDWISDNMIKMLYDKISSYGADVAICSYIEAENEFSTLSSKNINRKTIIYSGSDALKEMLYQTSFGNSAWGKLYRTDIMRKFPFPKGKLYEDLFTTYKVLYEANKVVYCSERLYYYRVNPNSIMHSDFNLRMFDIVDAIDEITEFVNDNAPSILPAANARKFSAYSQVIRWIPQNTEDKYVLKKKEELWQFIRSYGKTMRFDKCARKKNRLAAWATVFGKTIYCKL